MNAQIAADFPTSNHSVVVTISRNEFALDDLDTAADKAHAAVEETSAAALVHTQLNRKAWMYLGAVLDQKHIAVNRCNKALGAWVREKKLNTGRAQLSSVRSDAMWMWRNRAVLEGFENGISHPTALRAAARRAGYLWATNDKPDTKPKPDPDNSNSNSTDSKGRRSRTRKIFEVPDDELATIPPELHNRYRQMREKEHAAEQLMHHAERQRERYQRKMKGIDGVSEWLSKQEAHTVVRVLAASPHAERVDALDVFSRVMPLLEG